MTAPVMNESDAKSATSYKSTHSSRSSVLERAREYSRKIDESSRRAKSLERQSDVSSPVSTPRSQSAGRGGPSNQGNRPATRERALASVRKESTSQPKREPTPSNSNSHRRPKPTTPNTPGSIRSSRVSGDLTVSTAKSPQSRHSQGGRSSLKSRSNHQNNDEPHEPVVTPELLVDALSGHEDGLLAIAERLMEHYDSGYDAMGEAIIDAFADVQKLFQHVVEAAHMEGAAFEASRREEEIKDLKKQAGERLGGAEEDPMLEVLPQDGGTSPGGPSRHDEFIDQDVKDCLTDAIREGVSLRNNNKHDECYHLYEQACQNASSLLPVDSDHRGRLQLSIARAESMSPDRACAILRYAMDDVMRSGLRAGKAPLPADVSKRADVVLSKPKGHPSMNGSSGQPGVVQSSEEALASLVEEMKEILGAPVYENTPLQAVARRFWNALADAQKSQLRNEERLEQNLGKLKGDFLLARAEWEEKLTSTKENMETYKRKYTELKDGSYLDEARSLSMGLTSRSEEDNDHRRGMSYDTHRGTPGRTARAGVESVASLGSGLAQHARSLVGSFACSGINERTGGVLAAELAEGREDGERYGRSPEWRDRRRSSNGSPRSEGRHLSYERSRDGSRYSNDTSFASRSPARSKNSRSFREYSRSPQRVDV